MAEFKEDLEKAFKYFSDCNFSKALNIYLRLYNKDPNNLTIINNIVSTYIKLGDYNQAIKFADIYIDLNDKNVNVLFSKVIGLINLKRYEEALTVIDRLIELNPKDLKGYVFKYKILNILNKDDEKTKLFRNLKNYDSRTFARLIISLGFLKEQGDDITLKDFDNMAEAKIKAKSKEIVEDFSFLYEDIVNPFVEYRQNLFKSLLGNLVGENKDLLKLFSFIDEGNYETALSYVDDLLNKDLNNLDSIDDENLLDLDSDLDNQNISMTVEEEVKISINKDLITDDNKNLLIFKSVILFNLNDEKDALDLINNLLDIDRKSFEIWSIRAIIQSSLGNYNNASRSFKKALKIDDGNTDLWILYVYSLLLNGNLDKALKENENALEAVPDNEEFNDNLNNILNNYEMNN